MKRLIPGTRSISRPLAAALLLASTSVLAASALANEGHDLTFTGDGSFISPHGGQTIHVALYDVTAGEVVASDTGSVSTSEEPAFSFTFPGALEEGRLYDVHYWADSNFGGGSEGQCDPINIDHQWREALIHVESSVTLDVVHEPAMQAPVCTSFE
ncbi:MULTISPECIES: hypothetical protein [Halomonas]|uniref:hypothetical protein n=1 Tax=Halomonas TaxID=2745 RepID=UPI00068780A7|nr:MULTISPECIES: hypothetical protein [Halomonas]